MDANTGIDYYIELDQLVPSDPSNPQFYLHKDSGGATDGKRETNTASLNTALQNAATTATGSAIFFADSGGTEMPPASYRAIFADDQEGKDNGLGNLRKDVGAYVISGYDSKYSNKHFETRQDTYQNLSEEEKEALVKAVCDLATTVANAALELAIKDSATAYVGQADCNYVKDLIKAITVDQTFAAGNITAYMSNNTKMRKPINRYVSVYDNKDEKSERPGEFDAFVYAHLVSQLARKDMTKPFPSDKKVCGDDDDLSECCQVKRDQFESCTDNTCGRNQAEMWNRVYFTDASEDPNKKKPDVICYAAPVAWYNAPSPAYSSDGVVLNEERVDRWSTWAESTWDNEEVDMFLMGDPNNDHLTVAFGVIYFVVVIVLLYFFRKKVEHVELAASGAAENAHQANDAE